MQARYGDVELVAAVSIPAGPPFLSGLLVWPSCQEALDAPHLMCSPPV